MNDQPKDSVFMLEPTHMDLNYQRFQLTALTTLFLFRYMILRLRLLVIPWNLVSSMMK